MQAKIEAKMILIQGAIDPEDRGRQLGSEKQEQLLFEIACDSELKPIDGSSDGRLVLGLSTTNIIA
jgi:hypothetical protein